MDKFDLGDDLPQAASPATPATPATGHSDSKGNIYADSSSSGHGRSRKGLWIFLLLVLAAAGGATWWWLARPHNSADQLLYAAKYEKNYLADKPSLTPEKAAVRADKVRLQWRRVFEKFSASPDQSISARRRLSEFEAYQQQPDESRKWLDTIVQEFPEHKDAKIAARDLIKSLLAEAAESGGEKALELYEQAAKRCSEYGSVFSSDPALCRDFSAERCRIVDDKIAEPPIRAIRELEDFLEVYSDGKYVDEMLYRLALRHQMIGELARAEELFTRIIDEFPQSEYLRKAEFARAEVVGLLDSERGEKLWRELAEKYADDPELSEQARRKADRMAAKSEQERKDKVAQHAESEMQEASRGRYGSGGGPGDMGYGKPVPPREMLADFIDQKLDAQNYELQVLIDPSAHTIKVSGKLVMVNDGDEKNDFLLMLSSAMEIHSLSFNSAAAAFNRPQGKADVLQVVLDSPWLAGQTGELVFDISATATPLGEPGKLPEKVLKSLGRRKSREFAPALAHVNQEESAPDEDIADLAARTSQMGILMQLNETGYAISGAAWYPVTMVGDLFTATVDCEMPSGNALSFSGRRDSYGETGDILRGRWVCEHPMFALYFAYGPFQVKQRQVAGRTVSVMLADDCADRADEYLDCAEGILNFYCLNFGDYPFAKLDIIQVDLPPVLGGVGPAGMVLLHSSAVRDMDHAPVNLMAHEMSHHWWGNLVPINMIDGRYSQWLSEGFATYSDAMYTAHREGDEAFGERTAEMARLYLLAAESGGEEPIMKTFMGQNPFYRHVVYEKGALVLHALRYVLGDEKFFRLLRTYATEFAFTPSNVDDFIDLASQVAGEDMQWFFNEWLEVPGCPIYDPPVWTEATVAVSDVQTPATPATPATTPATPATTPATPATPEVSASDSDSVSDLPDGSRNISITISQPDRLSATPMDIFIHGRDDSGPRVKKLRFLPVSRVTELTVSVDFSVTEISLDDQRHVLHRMSDESGSWSGSLPPSADSF